MKLKSIFYCFIFFLLFNIFNINAFAQNIVVVIDPGHGGDAQGGTMDTRIERDINFITAKAMYDRLSQYDGIDVYMTRENNEDKELTRKQRLDIAKDLNADFLFSIHYNMSEYHTLFGSEVWIPSSGELYKKGYQFANIELEGLTSLGLYNRGIKNKLDSNNGEYYGILKYAVDYNIPAVIIEHCHLDEERDSAFWNEDSYKKFGEIDADSVAKYFNLKSSALNIDNTGYILCDVDNINSVHSQDYTEPEECYIELLDTDLDNGYATIKLNAYDTDTNINYYSYSLDSGKNFLRNEIYDNVNDNIIQIPLTEGKNTNLIVRVFNKYELYTDSNEIELPMIPVKETDTDESIIDTDESADTTTEEIVTIKTKNNTSIISTDVLLIALGCMFVFLLFVSLYIAIRINKLKRKRRRK